jgi:CSLREA domain-containing protein
MLCRSVMAGNRIYEHPAFRSATSLTNLPRDLRQAGGPSEQRGEMSPRSIRRAHARRIARDQRRAILRRRRELAAGVISAALLAPAAAQAAPFVVTQSTDAAADACDSNCTLRDAITAANGNGQADTITFAPGVTGPIVLTQGELPINENQSLTITGPGRDALTISGNDASRIFNITAPAGPTISISGLTLTHGSTTGSGGAISATGSATLDLSDLSITQSHADSQGGGIYSVDDLAITRSTLSGNTGSSGAGLYQSASGGTGSATVSDSSFTGNTATNNGGGIMSQGKYMTVTNSTVSGNTATNWGGGIAAAAKYGVDIKGSTVTGNTGGTGGGLGLSVGSIKYAAARVTDTTISGNQGIHGAGVEIDGVSAGSKVILNRSTLSDNHGGDNSFGGGLLIDYTTTGSIQLLDSTVSGNSATAGGGVSIGSDHNVQLIGSYNDRSGSIDFDNSTIAGNTAAAHGGGIYLSDYDSGSPSAKKSASAGITSTIVAGNTAGGAAQDLDRIDESTAGGFAGAFSLIRAPGDAPLTQHSVLIGVDPQLGALADHGGATKTMLPAGTSPVLDQGRSAEKVTVDQRGLDRVVDTGLPNAADGGDGTDIGAVELAADQVVLPPPPPKATFGVTVRGKPISPGTPLLPASLLPLDCSVTVVSMTSCSIELRSVKATKLSKKVTLPTNTLLAEGVANSAAGATNLSVKVKLTRDGKAALKAQPVGVDTTVGATAATGTTEALTAKGVVHLLANPTVTLGLGKRTTKLPKTTQQRLDQLAKLIPDAKTVTCTAYSDKGKGDAALTKKQAKAACDRLVKDGIKAKITSSGKGHAKPVASNKTKSGRALNRRVVIKFTL